MRLTMLGLAVGVGLLALTTPVWGGITPFLVAEPTLSPGHQLAPGICGPLVFWEEFADVPGGYALSVAGKDLATGQTYLLGTGADLVFDPIVADNVVSWVDNRNGDYDVYAYDLATGMEYPLVVAAADQVAHARDGNYLVWQDMRNSPPHVPPEYTDADLYGMDLSTGQEFTICTNMYDQAEPDISGNIVVWTDYRRGYPETCDIYGYDLSTGQEFKIAGAEGLDNSAVGHPAVSGDTIVWVDYAVPGGYALMGHHLSTGETFVIAQPGLSLNYPAIDGRYVVWSDGRNSEDVLDLDIWGYDLLTGKEFPIYEGPGDQKFPSISGNLVVWQSYIPGETTRVWGAYIPEPATALLLTAGLAGVLIRRRRGAARI